MALASFAAPLLAADRAADFEERLRRALTQLQEGRLQEAETSLLALERERPEDPAVAYRLGLLLLRDGDAKAAAERLGKAAERFPEQPEVWLALARAQMLQGAAGEARAALDNAAGSFSSERDPRLVLLVARAYRQVGDPLRAVATLQDGLSVAPDSDVLALELGQLFLDHRSAEAAERILEPAVQHSPANPELHRLLALAYYAQGRTDPAIRSFLAAVDLAPQERIYYASLETILPEAGDLLPEILQRLDAYSMAAPTSALGPYLMALADKIESPNSPRIRILLREALRREPAFWPAHYELGVALSQSDDDKAAIESLEAAISINPDFPAAHYALAQLYAAIGDRSAARRERMEHHRLMTAARETAQERQREMPRIRTQAPPQSP